MGVGETMKRPDSLELFVWVFFIIVFVILIVGIVKADGLNGTELIENPVETIFSPFTDFFKGITGNGAVFYLIPLIVLTFGVYEKTKNPIMPAMFMIASGALLSTGTMFLGMPDISIAFTVFIAMGITALFIGLILQRR